MQGKLLLVTFDHHFDFGKDGFEFFISVVQGVFIDFIRGVGEFDGHFGIGKKVEGRVDGSGDGLDRSSKGENQQCCKGEHFHFCFIIFSVKLFALEALDLMNFNDHEALINRMLVYRHHQHIINSQESLR